ncbi:hypothetical protein F5146DRAFT_1000320 [Armillaria mellea]|nr:hypothetical protein F5146DRAFT_1000320 [Armillaria mellea]
MSERDDLQRRLSETQGAYDMVTYLLTVQGKRLPIVTIQMSYPEWGLAQKAQENETIKVHRDQAVTQLRTMKQELQDLILCSICMDGIKVPAVGCLLQWVQANPPQSNVCPFCRERINDLPIFPRSFSKVAEVLWGKQEEIDGAMMKDEFQTHTW